MFKDDFVADLPHSATCECCRKTLPSVQWQVTHYGSSEWMGIGLAKCDSCNWLKIAAAGSDESSHKEAQRMRMKLVFNMGIRAGW